MTVANNIREKGFTIVELMIATTVLSVILVLVTVMMIGIGKLYFKGVNQARIQDVTRSVTDQIAQDLKFNDTFRSGSRIVFTTDGAIPIGAYCIGNSRYSYIKNRKIGTGNDVNGRRNFPHVLWRDNGTPSPDELVSGTGCNPINVTQPINNTPSGSELISPNSRLTEFNVSPISPYTIQVGVAYGDSDLLNLAGIDSTCKSSAGDQFCSTARLVTTVVQRISGD